MLSGTTMNIGIPRFSGIDPPPPPSTNNIPPITAQTPSVPNNSNNAAYAITAADHVKYHELFITYDTDRDGYVFNCVRTMNSQISFVQTNTFLIYYQLVL